MSRTIFTFCIMFLCSVTYLSAQKINGEIFIPLSNRSEIWLKPKLDTLENGKEYEFKIRVSSEYQISQFLFEKGLAVHNDSVLVISPNSSNYGSFDEATLRVIVTSIKGSRTILFQKKFIVKVPEKLFPVLSNPKINLMKINDKEFLDRNRPYGKAQFVEGRPFLTLYDNLTSLNPLKVENVTIALFEKEGKQYESKADTLSSDAIKELKKIRNPTPVYIKVDALNGKAKKIAVWNKVVIYAE